MKLKFIWISVLVTFPLVGVCQEHLVTAEPYLSALKKQKHQHYILEKSNDNTKDTFEIALLDGGLKSKTKQRKFIALNNKQAVIHLDTLSAYYRPARGYLYSKDLKVPDAAYAWSNYVFPLWGVKEAEPQVFKHQWDSVKSWESNGLFYLYLKRDTLTMPGAAGAFFDFEYTLVFDMESKQAQRLIIKTKGDMSPVFEVSYEVLALKPGFHTLKDFENWALNKWSGLNKKHSD